MRLRIPFFLILLLATIGCSKNKNTPLPSDETVKKLRQTLSEGKYDEALKLAKEISNQVPPSPSAEEALYLQGYVQVYGKSDFKNAHLPLKHLLDFYPNGVYAPDAQKLLADCQYWQGHYNKAGREYKKLLESYGERGMAPYAQMQAGNCLLLDDKVDDALTIYHELVEKFPVDPIADSAQLMVANTYLKLQNPKQAKTELKKLMSFTHDKDLAQSAQKALRQIEAEEPFRKGIGVPE